jgi:hypothetical protein
MQSCYQVNPKYILHFTNKHDAKQKLFNWKSLQIFQNYSTIINTVAISALCLCATLLIFLHSSIAIL